MRCRGREVLLKCRLGAYYNDHTGVLGRVGWSWRDGYWEAHLQYALGHLAGVRSGEQYLIPYHTNTVRSTVPCAHMDVGPHTQAKQHMRMHCTHARAAALCDAQ